MQSGGNRRSSSLGNSAILRARQAGLQPVLSRLEGTSARDAGFPSRIAALSNRQGAASDRESKLVCGDSLASHFFQCPYNRDAAEARQGHVAEDVDIRPERRLLCDNLL